MPRTQEEMFEYQVEKLRGNDLLVSGAEVDKFRDFIPEKGPFLLVPARPKTLGADDLQRFMRMVNLDGETGSSLITNPEEMHDIVAFPEKASLLMDIEDGSARRGRIPAYSRNDIAREQRYSYGLWYGIIHVILFPEVLKDHFPDLAGTRYLKDSIPCFYVLEGRPVLIYIREDAARPCWGVPSVGRIVVP